jgi:hypothetical protein
MEEKIKEEGKKSGKVELFFSWVDRIFKVALLVLIVVGIVVYYTSTNGRYHYIENKDNYLFSSSDSSYEVFDTRTGTLYQTIVRKGPEVGIITFNVVNGKINVFGEQLKTIPTQLKATDEHTVREPVPPPPGFVIDTKKPEPRNSGQIK